MSAALLRKSLALVDSSQPSGFTSRRKNPPIPEAVELGILDWSEERRHQSDKQETASPAAEIKKQSKKKSKSSKRKRAEELAPEEEEQKRVEENVRRLLQLSSRPVPKAIAAKLIARTQKPKRKIKAAKKAENTVFTEADFKNFNKQYFGR